MSDVLLTVQIFSCVHAVVKVYVSKHDVVSMNAKIQDDASGIAECLTSCIYL